MKKSQTKHPGFWLGAGLGLAAGWSIAQQLWALWQVSRKDVYQTLNSQINQAPKGIRFEQETATDKFTVRRIIEDGIERVSYLPKQRRFETPILMQHGMWHGAWCWQQWQELLAEWGWESHAHSLPGHAGSPEQQKIPLCTLDYYLGFLKAEVDRLSHKPILMGYSMGGALTQWYLKYIGDLPAAILVAPWPSHSAFRAGAALLEISRLDPVGSLLSAFKWRAAFGSHSPKSAAAFLITEGAIYTPEELFARLSPESILVTYQHNPPFWYPPQTVNTPMLWLGGKKDVAVPEHAVQASAQHYKADYHVIKGVGHNLMMEHNYHQTAELIHTWLVEQGMR